MRAGLDPRNPAFEWRGEAACRKTQLFISPDGRLFWVPYIAMRSLFEREYANHSFPDWHKRLMLKERK